MPAGGLLILPPSPSSFGLSETSVYAQGIALYTENTYSKRYPEGEDTGKVKNKLKGQ